LVWEKGYFPQHSVIIQSECARVVEQLTSNLGTSHMIP